MLTTLSISQHNEIGVKSLKLAMKAFALLPLSLLKQHLVLICSLEYY